MVKDKKKMPTVMEFYHVIRKDKNKTSLHDGEY